MKDLPKRCFLLKVLKYHSCTNKLGKIEENILYKTFHTLVPSSYMYMYGSILQQKKS